MNFEEFNKVVPSGWHFQVLCLDGYSFSFQGEAKLRKEWKLFACNNPPKGQKSKEVSLTSYNSLADLLDLAQKTSCQ